MEAQTAGSRKSAKFWLQYLLLNTVVLVVAATQNREFLRLALSVFVCVTGGIVAGTNAGRIRSCFFRAIALTVWGMILFVFVSDIVLRWT